jgi:hypothetical protein
LREMSGIAVAVRAGGPHLRSQRRRNPRWHAYTLALLAQSDAAFVSSPAPPFPEREPRCRSEASVHAALHLVMIAGLAAACGRIGYEAGPGGDGDAVIVCPEVCDGGCGDGTCEIRGDAPALRTTIECPPRLPCRVICADRGACLAAVDCSAATACEVRCTGDDSCHGGVVCGAGPCSIECRGRFSCGAIDCADTTSCSIACTGALSCFSEVTCCDAGSCAIACAGNGSCDAPITCDGGEPCTEAC